MSVKKFVVGTYKEEHDLFHAIDQIRSQGVDIHDVYTPFPIHGLDGALGYKETDLHVAGFIYGITGTITALSFMSWIFTENWPQNFGGKPFFSLPAFIPITFELTILFAAVGMVLTFCYLNQIMPGVKKHIFNPRQTDDLFVVTLEMSDDSKEAELMSTLRGAGADDVEVQLAEEGWWFGTFDNNEPYTKS